MPQSRLQQNTAKTAPSQAQKEQAARWFEDLRGRFCAMLEGLESEHSSSATFARKAWQRATPDNLPGGGGEMALLHGQLFEKAGVNVSTVFGHFSPDFRKQIPGAEGARAVVPSA
ncbi:MAG TPA: coproporphyrinogen III oxidase, partial [Alphaproteobacteria bacterium]|nr:coproporphyrinogen III oxidase [Alphaproteobacteria bacterium]